MISRLRLIASPAEVFMSSRRIHREIDYIRVYAFITESGGKLCLHAVTWMIGIVVARRLFEERTEIFMRYAYNIVYGICNGKSRKSDVINSCAHTYIYYIYIYNTSRFTCSIESSTVNRGLKRVLSFFAKRVHATYIPCVTMCRVYVDTYLKKLRGQRRKKPHDHSCTRETGLYVYVSCMCARVCVTLSGSSSQLLFTVYDAWTSIQKADLPQEGSAVCPCYTL